MFIHSEIWYRNFMEVFLENGKDTKPPLSLQLCLSGDQNNFVPRFFLQVRLPLINYLVCLMHGFWNPLT